MRRPAPTYEGAACGSCGSCTRYVSNGKCKHCQNKHSLEYQQRPEVKARKVAKRNVGQPYTKAEQEANYQAAVESGAITYEGRLCKTCSGCTRYTLSRRCKTCQIRRSIDYHRSPAGKVSHTKSMGRYHRSLKGRSTHRAYRLAHVDDKQKYDKAYLQRPEVKERKRKRFHERYHSDPEFRQRRIELSKKWHQRPEVKARKKARFHERYHSDPDFQQRWIELAKKWNAKNKENRYENENSKAKGEQR